MKELGLSWVDTSAHLWAPPPFFFSTCVLFLVPCVTFFFLPEVLCFTWALGFHFGPFVLLFEILRLWTVPIPASQILKSKSNAAASASASPFIRCWRHSIRIKNHKYNHSPGLLLHCRYPSVFFVAYRPSEIVVLITEKVRTHILHKWHSNLRQISFNWSHLSLLGTSSV